MEPLVKLKKRSGRTMKAEFKAVAQLFGDLAAATGSYEARVGGLGCEQFLREHGLLAVPHIWIATSPPVEGRSWELEEGRQPAFYPDPNFRGGASSSARRT